MVVKTSNGIMIEGYLDMILDADDGKFIFTNKAHLNRLQMQLRISFKNKSFTRKEYIDILEKKLRIFSEKLLLSAINLKFGITQSFEGKCHSIQQLVDIFMAYELTYKPLIDFDIELENIYSNNMRVILLNQFINCGFDINVYNDNIKSICTEYLIEGNNFEKLKYFSYYLNSFQLNIHDNCMIESIHSFFTHAAYTAWYDLMFKNTFDNIILYTRRYFCLLQYIYSGNASKFESEKLKSLDILFSSPSILPQSFKKYTLKPEELEELCQLLDNKIDFNFEQFAVLFTDHHSIEINPDEDINILLDKIEILDGRFPINLKREYKYISKIREVIVKNYENEIKYQFEKTGNDLTEKIHNSIIQNIKKIQNKNINNNQGIRSIRLLAVFLGYYIPDPKTFFLKYFRPYVFHILILQQYPTSTFIYKLLNELSKFSNSSNYRFVSQLVGSILKAVYSKPTNYIDTSTTFTLIPINYELIKEWLPFNKDEIAIYPNDSYLKIWQEECQKHLPEKKLTNLVEYNVVETATPILYLDFNNKKKRLAIISNITISAILNLFNLNDKLDIDEMAKLLHIQDNIPKIKTLRKNINILLKHNLLIEKDSFFKFNKKFLPTNKAKALGKMIVA